MSTLTDRYVHATLASVPEERRDDIGRELRASVDDMVEARTDAGEPHAAAERAVLTELGDPARLASQYTQRPLHLIGPRYFLVWKRLLVTLLTWIPLTIVVIVATVSVLDGSDLGGVIGDAISAGIETAVQIAVWTTVVFAVLERLDVDAGIEGWTPDKLPEVPEHRQVSLADTVVAVGFLLVFAGVLIAQQFRSWVPGDDGRDIPILDPALWSSWMPVLLGSLGVSIGLEVWKYRAGRWTFPVAVGNLLAGLAFALPVAFLAWRDELLNPAFVQMLDLGEQGITNLGRGIVVASLAVVVWEAVEGFWKAHLARRGQRTAGFESPRPVR